MFMLTPVGALGLAIGGILALLDSLGVINTGFTEFLQNVRLGGHKIGTWMKAAWVQVFKSWEWLKGMLITGWENMILTVKRVAFGIFRAFVWVPQKVLEAFDALIVGVVGKLNWLVRQMNRFGIGIGEIAAPSFAKDAAKFFSDLNETAAKLSGAAWDEFEKNRQARAKDTARVLAALQGVQEKLFTDDIEGIKKVASAAAVATATAGAAAPGMPTAAGGAAGGDGAVFGTFSGRGAAAFAGGGAVEKESLRTQKFMAQLLQAIASNTKNPTAVYG